jgi:hypothetical protein
MNTTNSQSNNNENTFLESLRYSSLFSNQTFEIDSQNNLHITDLSAIKQRNDIVPLDFINPQPISKKHLNKPLMLLALASALVSSALFASTIFMGQLWAVTFAIVFWVFGMATLSASFKNRTTIYQYKFANTETLLFSLSEPATQNKQVKLFTDALNKRIINLNEQNEVNSRAEVDEESAIQLDTVESPNEMDSYLEDKQSQYTEHLNFLFNHGIVDEVLYKRLNKKINQQISDSENRFMKTESDTFSHQTTPNNVINFPVNA